MRLLYVQLQMVFCTLKVKKFSLPNFYNFTILNHPAFMIISEIRLLSLFISEISLGTESFVIVFEQSFYLIDTENLDVYSKLFTDTARSFRV